MVKERVSDTNQVMDATFFPIQEKLSRKFKDARLTVIVVQDGVTNLFPPMDENKNEIPVYYGSAIKPVFAAAISQKATAEKIAPDEKKWQIRLTSGYIDDLYDDYFTEPKYPKSEPTTKRVSKITEDFTDEKEFELFRTYLAEFTSLDRETIQVVNRKIDEIEDASTRLVARGLLYRHAQILGSTTDEETTRERKKLFKRSETLGYTSLEKLLTAALGPSSNAALSFIKDLVGGPDAVQKFVDRELGAEALLTINNSEKEKGNGLWNAGRLSELFTLYRRLLDRKIEGIDEKYYQIMISTMRRFQADPAMEVMQPLQEKFKELGIEAEIIEKSGYYPSLDLFEGDDTIKPLMDANGWSDESRPKITYINDMFRIIYPNGKVRDIAFAIGFPHETEANDQAQKEEAYQLVFESLLPLMLRF